MPLAADTLDSPPFNGKRLNSAVTLCDVMVIGAGPAGSAIATLLAERGWNVHVLEKESHPRFHIGESLLPGTLPLLKRLGVISEVDRIGIKKYGAELVSPYHDKPVTLHFSQGMDRTLEYAYQVRRSEFDHILLENARRKGAVIHQEWRATDVDVSDPETCVVRATNRLGEGNSWQAFYMVDATGRDTFLSTKLGTKRHSRHHRSAAIFGHFEGVLRHQGIDEGNITICWFDHGWIWLIPFKDGVTSVGAVCWPSYLKTRRSDLDRFLWETLALCPPAFERLRHAKLITSAMTAGNYSYRSHEMMGHNFIMVGDAYAFIDPVFSSGVHLALNSAVNGADVVDAYLRRSPDLPQLQMKFQGSVKKGLSSYSWLIHRFMQPALRDLFMEPRSIFQIQEGVISLLAGDVFRKTPIRRPLMLFKVVYYIYVILSPLRNMVVLRKRLGAAHE